MPHSHPLVAALLGQPAAEALAAATAHDAALAAAVAPRTALAWVRHLGNSYDGDVPGGGHLTLQKGADGLLAGTLELGGQTRNYQLAKAEDLAAELGGGPVPELVGPAARLGQALDRMVPVAAAIRAVELLKTSHNAKMHRRYVDGDPEKGKLTREQVDARRERYARTLGLEPKKLAGSMARINTPIVRNDGKLPYGGQFGIAHELGHAMHVPYASSQERHNKALEQASRSPRDMESYVEYPRGYDRYRHEDDVINTSLEHKIDRRAGVDPDMHSPAARLTEGGAVGYARGQINTFDEGEMEPALVPWSPPERGTPWSEGDKAMVDYDAGETVGDAREAQRDRSADACKVIRRFDAGARFTSEGRVERPSGLDHRINVRGRKGWVGAPRPAGASRVASNPQTEFPWGPETSSPAPRPVHKFEPPGQPAKPAAPVAPAQPGGPKPPTRGVRKPQRPKAPSAQGLAGQETK